MKFTENSNWRKSMRIKKFLALGMTCCLFMVTPVQSIAAPLETQTDLLVQDQNSFRDLMDIIILEKEQFPTLGEDELLEHLDIKLNNRVFNNRGITDIWNALTDSEKKLVIRYPFDALKVNTAKNIATNQTEIKLGRNGLGDKSDAFRHGIWNAEMTVLIGIEKAELFATAHEDKDISGNEADGFSKTAHKEMDLHNNEIGRQIGQKNENLNESEMSDLIYQEINKVNSNFIWLHE